MRPLLVQKDGKNFIVVRDESQVRELFPDATVIEDENSYTVITAKGARFVFKPLSEKQVFDVLSDAIPRFLLEEAKAAERSKAVDALLKALVAMRRTEKFDVLQLRKTKVWLWGKQGVGKTTATVKALATLAKYHGALNFAYFQAQRITPDSLEELEKLQKEERKLDVLIIDDLNPQVFQKTEMAKDFVYLVSLLPATATITVSNYSPGEMVESLKKLGVESWIISRVARLAGGVEMSMEGKDRRAAEARSREKQKVVEGEG